MTVVVLRDGEESVKQWKPHRCEPTVRVDAVCSMHELVIFCCCWLQHTLVWKRTTYRYIFSFQLWRRSSDDLLVVRDSLHGEESVVELSEYLFKRREATLHVRSLTGDAHHKFPLFLLDASCCGSFAYWSIKGLLASLGMKKILF